MIFLSEFEIIVASIFMVLNYIILSETILKYKQINKAFAQIVIDKKVTPKGSVKDLQSNNLVSA